MNNVSFDNIQQNIDIEINYNPSKKILPFYSPSFEKEKTKLRIFGKEFVNNNQDKCKIIYKDEKYELKEFFEDIDNNYNHKDEIIIILSIFDKIIDVSYMFHDCIYLSSFPDLPKIFNSEATDIINENSESNSMSYLFVNSEENYFDSNNINNKYNELNTIKIPSSLSSIKEINKTNFMDISEMYPKVNLLSILIDSNIINMS